MRPTSSFAALLGLSGRQDWNKGLVEGLGGQFYLVVMFESRWFLNWSLFASSVLFMCGGAGAVA